MSCCSAFRFYSSCCTWELAYSWQVFASFNKFAFSLSWWAVCRARSSFAASRSFMVTASLELAASVSALAAVSSSLDYYFRVSLSFRVSCSLLVRLTTCNLTFSSYSAVSLCSRCARSICWVRSCTRCIACLESVCFNSIDFSRDYFDDWCVVNSNLTATSSFFSVSTSLEWSSRIC